MEEHIDQHPGTRPWAWWEWDEPEPRRQVNPGPKTSGNERWFGMARLYLGCPPDDMYEFGTDYLDRLELLTEDERRQLGRLSGILTSAAVLEGN